MTGGFGRLATHSLFLFASIGLVGCAGNDTDGSTDDAGSEPDVAIAETSDPREVVVDLTEVPWAVNLEVDLDDMIRQQSGLYVQVLSEGRGVRSTAGDSMAVHYRVWLPNGRLMDASYNHDPPEPLAMQLGVTALIDGWTQGVTGMRVGERRRLVVPHELAYGPAGHPVGIPPYSPLVYEVELMALQPGEMPEPSDG